MDLPAYMVGIGTFLAGAAGLTSLIVKRGEDGDRERDLERKVDRWHARYDEEHAKRKACEAALDAKRLDP